MPCFALFAGILILMVVCVGVPRFYPGRFTPKCAGKGLADHALEVADPGTQTRHSGCRSLDSPVHAPSTLVARWNP